MLNLRRARWIENAIAPLLRKLLPSASGMQQEAAKSMESLEQRVMLNGSLQETFKLPFGTSSDQVYDSSGTLYVAFRDQNATNLKYITKSPDGVWSPITTVDSTPGTGGDLSIALQPNGRPAIAYYDGVNDDLKYASFNGSSWSIQTVDTGGTGDVGKGASLAFNTNSVAFIAYMDVTNHDLKVARWLTDHWSISSVDTAGDVGRECSLAVNPATGRYAVVYLDKTQNKLRYVEDTSTTPSFVYLDTAAGTTDLLSGTSIAFSSTGVPSIAYYDPEFDRELLVQRNGPNTTDTWSGIVLETGITAPSVSETVVTSSGKIDVGYWKDMAVDELHAARYDGMSWHLETMMIGGGATFSFAEAPNGNFSIISQRDDMGGYVYQSEWYRDRWVEVYDYLLNYIDYSPALGAVKGAQATLDTHSGNDYDQAALLIRELARVGVAGKYVTGSIRAPSADVAKWLGVADANAAEAVLDAVGGAGYATQTGANMDFTHAWVQITEPAGATRSIDSSWKARDLSAGIAAPVNYVPLSIYDGADLALLRPVTGAQEAGFEARLAVDGDLSTRWATSQFTPTLELDLGATFNLDRIRLTWAAQYASTYSIETSLDHTNWTILLATSTENGGEDNYTALADDTGSIARWVRLKPTNGPSNGYSLADFRIYGFDDLGRAHTATTSSPNATYPIVNLSDGNSTSEWRSTAAGSQWVKIDLGAVVDISGLRLKWGGDGYASGYNVKVSDDNTNWKTVKRITSGDGGVDQITGLATRGRYVQIDLNTVAGGTVYSMFDMEVLSAPKANELPIDIYQAKVRSYLAIAQPGKSTADAPLGGPILGSQVFLPQPTLGYTVNSSNTPVANIATNDKQRVKIALNVSGTDRINYTLNTADVSGQIISIAYPITGSLYYPELRIDGVAVATSAAGFSSGTAATLTLTVYAGDGNATADRTYVYDRTVGQPLGIGIQNAQLSGPMLAGINAKLRDKAVEVFDCSNIDFYPELLVGAIAATYMGQADSDYREIATMQGLVPVMPLVGVGVVTGDTSWETRWDLPTPQASKNTYFDIKGAQAQMLPSASGVSSSAIANTALHIAWDASALESKLLSQFINAPTISTWEGLKAAAASNTPIYEIWSAGDPTSGSPAPTYYAAFDSTRIGARRATTLSRNGSTVTATAVAHGFANGAQVDIRGATQPEYNGTYTITLVDANTFTYTISGTPAAATGTIWSVPTGSVLDWTTGITTNTTSQKDAMKASVRDGGSIVAPKSPVTIGEWTGVVWAASTTDVNATPSMLIMRSTETKAHGAAAANNGPVSPIPIFGVNLLAAPVSDWSTTVGTGVVLSDGNIHRSERDFALPNVGFPLAFERTYDSLQMDDLGMGVGWSYSFGDRLELATDGSGNITWKTSQGIRHEFVPDGSGGYKSIGLFGALTHPTGEYIYRERSGIMYHFNDSSLRLTKIEDAHGEGVLVTQGTYGPTAVQDIKDATRVITFSYNASGKISIVADWNRPSKTVTSITRSGAVATVTATAHGYATSDVVEIRGADQPEYNGFFTITVTGVNTFTYTVSGTPANPATGTIVAKTTAGSWQYGYTTSRLTSASLAGQTDLLSMSYTYNSSSLFNGLLKSITDNNRDATTSYEYYPNGRAFRITDPQGNSESYYYDQFNQVTTQYDKNGSATSYGLKRDGLGLVQTVSNVDGTRQDNEFLGTLLARDIDEIGRNETYQYYSGTGNVSQQTGQDGLVTNFEYQDSTNSSATGFNLVTKITLPGGRETDFAYSTTGDLTSKTQVNGAQSLVTSYTYPASPNNRGLPSSSTTPNGNAGVSGNHTTDYTYNAAGQLLTQTTHPSGGDIVHKYTYDGRGFRTGDFIMSGTTKNPTLTRSGSTVTATATAHGFTTGDLVEIRGATQTEYNGFFPIIMTGANTFTYTISGTPVSPATGSIVAETTATVAMATVDSVGHVLVSKGADPSGTGQLTVTNVYKAGNLISVTNPMGMVTTSSYDRLGRVVATTGPDGGKVKIKYDRMGNIIETTDPGGAPTVTIFDNRGRPIQTVFVNQTLQRTRYDALGRVVASVNESGNAATAIYDSGDRVSATVDALSQYTTTRYNNVGQAVELIDWANNTDVLPIADASYSGSPLPVVGTGDFDGDGDDDLIRYNTTSGGYTIQLMSGSGVVSSSTPAAFPDTTTTGWKIIGIGDVDKDGDDDIVWQNGPDGSKNQLWRSNGITPSVLNNAYLPAWTGAQMLGVADYDADGDADLLWRDSTGANIAWYQHDQPGGSLTYTMVLITPIPSGQSFVASADVTGDGKADILFRNTSTNAILLKQINALGLTDWSVGTLDTNWVVAATGDIDRSGTADLVWHNNSTSENKLWLMQPNGTHYDIVLESDSARSFITLADFSSDGRPDLVWSNFSSGSSGFRVTNGTTKTLDTIGRVTQVRGSGGFVGTFVYDANGNITNQTQYDTTGLTSIPADPSTLSASLKRIITTQYDVLDRPTQVTNPDGKSIVSTYDKADHVLSTTNELGRITTFTYDRAGRLTSKLLPDPDGSGPLDAPTESYKFDANGNIIQVTAPLNHVKKFTFDSMGRNTGEFVMAGSTTAPSLTRSGSTVTATATAHGYRTGDVVEIRGASQAEYNGFFRITVTGVNTFTYTITGTPATPATGTIAGEKTVRSAFNTYSVVGALQSTTDAMGNVTTITTDSMPRVIKKTLADPDGAGPMGSPSTTYVYDVAGNVISMIDAGGNQTSYTYDALNRLTSQTSPYGTLTELAPKTNLSYLFNQATKITDAYGHGPAIGYDSLGRKISQTLADPDGPGPLSSPIVTSTYDALGNLKSVTDALGQTTTYAYDKLNRMTTQTGMDPDGAGALTSPVTTYTYDGVGNLLSTVDPTGKVLRASYDNLNRKTGEFWMVGTTKTVAGLSRSGSTATASVTAHGYSTGNIIQIRGADQSEYNGFFTITVVDANTFTYTISGTPTTATGTIEAEKAVVGTKYDYDAIGNLTGETDALGNRTSYEYNLLNQRTRMTQPDPDGGGALTAPVTDYTYDPNGNLLTTKDPDLRVTQNSYDRINRKTGTFQLDSTSNLKTITSITRSGSTATATITNHGYATGDVIRISGANQPEYNGFFVITNTGANTFTYTIYGTPASATAAPGETLQALKSLQSTRYEYDGTNRMVASFDGKNNRTSYSYDNAGRQTGVHTMAGSPKAVSVINRTDSTVVIDTSTAHGFVTNDIVELRGTDPAEYNGFYRITVIDSMRFSFTIQGTPNSCPSGVMYVDKAIDGTRDTYDSASRLTSVADASGNVTAYVYDDMNRPVKEHFMSQAVKTISSLTRSGSTATATSTAHGYSTGDTVEIRGARQLGYNGFATITVVDANTFTFTVSGTPASPATGPIVAEKPLRTTSTEYDANSRTTAGTDRNGGRRYFVYDKLDRVLEEHWLAAGIGISSITYSGTTATVTTSTAHGYSNNDWVEISGADQLPYDGLFQITVTGTTTFTYTMASSPGANATGSTKLARKSTRKISYAYDAANRVSSSTDPDSALAYTYDAAGRLSTTDNNNTPNAPRVILTSTYDAAGRRTGLSSTVGGSNDFSNTYIFDNIGRMTSAQQSGTGVAQKRADFAYNASSQYTKITRYSNTAGTTQVGYSDYGYDTAKRLTSLVHRKPDSTALVTYGWTYDTQGRVNVFSVTVSGQLDGTVTYSYDAASQLTGADYTSGSITDETYSYDASGNRTNSGYSTGQENRLSGDGTYTYTYDTEGNRTRRTKTSDGTYIDYTYDLRNRLTDVVYKTSGGTPTKAIQYIYDMYDRRIRRRLDAAGDGTYESEERYIYDGDAIVLVYNSSNGLISRYLQGPDIDQPLAEETGGAVKWFLADEQGTIRDMQDGSTNNLVSGSHVIYNSFGIATNSTTPGRFGYTGREWDADAGMYYYRARWYDQNIGRFISTDPAGFDAGDANLYRYVRNNSSNLTDPNGKCDFFSSECWADTIHNTVRDIGHAIGDILGGAFDFAKDAIHKFFHGTELLFKGIVNGANEIIDKVKDAVDDFAQGVMHIGNEIHKVIKGFARDVVKGIVDGGAWLAHVSHLGTIGIDLGPIFSISFSHTSGHNKGEISMFGISASFDSHDGKLDTNIGVKLSLPIPLVGDFSVGYINSSLTVGLSPTKLTGFVKALKPEISLKHGTDLGFKLGYGPVSGSITYRYGEISGVNVTLSPLSLMDPNSFSVPTSYASNWTKDAHNDWSHTETWSVKLDAKNWFKSTDWGGINESFDKLKETIGENLFYTFFKPPSVANSSSTTQPSTQPTTQPTNPGAPKPGSSILNLVFDQGHFAGLQWGDVFFRSGQYISGSAPEDRSKPKIPTTNPTTNPTTFPTTIPVVRTPDGRAGLRFAFR